MFRQTSPGLGEDGFDMDGAFFDFGCYVNAGDEDQERVCLREGVLGVEPFEIYTGRGDG